MVYLANVDGDASRSHNDGDAVTLFVRSVAPTNSTGAILYGQPFYIMTTPGPTPTIDRHASHDDLLSSSLSLSLSPTTKSFPTSTPSSRSSSSSSLLVTPVTSEVHNESLYLERTHRISDETPTTPTHYSCRFGLGFVASPTQTWSAHLSQSNHGDGLISLDALIGLQIRGTSNDEWSAQYREPRWLTLRHHDEPTVIVRVMKSHELVMFANAVPGEEHRRMVMTT
jgi:hypothetical protein